MPRRFRPENFRWFEMAVWMAVGWGLVRGWATDGNLVGVPLWLYWFPWACARVRRQRRTGNVLFAPPAWARPFGLRRLGFLVLTVMLIPLVLFWLGVRVSLVTWHPL